MAEYIRPKLNVVDTYQIERDRWLSWWHARLLRQLSGFDLNLEIPEKIVNEQHQQWSGHNILARQKIQKNALTIVNMNIKKVQSVPNTSMVVCLLKLPS
jgi:hypothetical protein